MQTLSVLSESMQWTQVETIRDTADKGMTRSEAKTAGVEFEN